MALEIERRFLIKNDNWKEFINKKIYIEQGYFSKSIDGWIIRVRLIGKNSKITLKKHIKGFTNFEFEYSIPRSDAEIIMSNLSNTIKKDRFFLEIENFSLFIFCSDLFHESSKIKGNSTFIKAIIALFILFETSVFNSSKKFII